MSDFDELSGFEGEKRLSEGEIGRKVGESRRNKQRLLSFTHD